MILGCGRNVLRGVITGAGAFYPGRRGRPSTAAHRAQVDARRKFDEFLRSLRCPSRCRVMGLARISYTIQVVPAGVTKMRATLTYRVDVACLGSREFRS